MKSRDITIGFQKKSRLNGWFIWICSWFAPVFVGHVSGSSALLMYRGERRRVFAEYSEKLLIEQLAWRFYRRRYRGGRDCHFRFRAAGLELDYAPLLLKAAADEMITLAGIRYLARKEGLLRQAYFGKLLWPAIPRRTSSGRFITTVHSVLAWMDEAGEAVFRLAVQVVRILVAVLSRRRNGSGINALWTGIMPTEVGKFDERRSFYWPDRLGNSRLSNLYLLIRMPDRASRIMLQEEGVQTVSQFHILCFVPKLRLALLSLRLAATCLRLFMPAQGNLALSARLCGMHLDALSWTEFMRAVPVRLATATTSTWTSTRPLLLALQAAGAKTAVWCYSTNSIPFQHPGGRAYFNGRTRTVLEAERIYAWNNHIAGWYRENLCHHPRNEVVICGPVMCGDSRLCLRPRLAGKNLRVAVFDVSLPAGTLRELVGMPHLSPEYHERFWSDIARLVREIPDITLIVKPKRSLDSRVHSFGAAFRSLVEDEALRQEGRIEMTEDDSDPYKAIADSDVAVCMPFTSPALTAWHFGRIGIFHDSLGLVAHHRYQDMGAYFTRSYDALASLIRDAVEASCRGESPQLPERMRCFVGRHPMENPQEALLKDLAEWALGPEIKSTSRLAIARVQEEVPA